MPSYDSSRSRLRLADRHITVLGRLAEGRTPSAELFPVLGELQETGLVGDEGQLSPLLGELLGALSDPALLIRVEITGEHGPVNHGIIVGQESVVAYEGWPGEEESEYIPIEPNTLVFELARMVHLRRSGGAEPELARIETTMGALDSAFTVLAEPSGDLEVDRAAARKTLVECGSPATDEQRDAFADLVLALNAYWRVTVAWDGEHEGEPAAKFRALAVWDCGSRGYWIREQPTEPILPGQVRPDSTLHLVRSSAGEIWKKLTGLLPEKEELLQPEQ